MNSTADVIIVGAGIVGAACAESLAQSGRSVLVLDRSFPGGGTTSAGMGHILVLEDSPAQLALTVASRRLWNERGTVFHERVEREGRGTLWVATDDDDARNGRDKAATLGAAGVVTEWLDAADLRREEPELSHDLVGGLRIPDDSVVYPAAAARALLDRALDAGARFESAEVRGLRSHEVTLRDGRVLNCDQIIVAAGWQSLQLIEDPPPRLAIIPKRGHLIITDRGPEFLRHHLVELGYLKSAHGGDATSVAFNAQPRPTGQVLLGSSREWNERDSKLSLDLLARMIRHAVRFLPRLGRLRALRGWTGLRPATTDNLPLIGPLPGTEGLHLACGHEGLGITTSLITAQLLCAQLTQTQPLIDPTPYLPQRFLGTGTPHD
ncbi:MAG: FAD-binding oxidoreductase [Planctomycetes bacterium]|nr:FAD-binding oxidoreductase [Planctomycetota bacterium]